MASPLKLKAALPKNSKLNELLNHCEITHELHLHELSDGALSMVCFTCPFHLILDEKEEEVVRQQMREQGIKEI